MIGNMNQKILLKAEIVNFVFFPDISSVTEVDVQYPN